MSCGDRMAVLPSAVCRQEFPGPGPPLVSELEDFVNGCDWDHLPNLREWVGALVLLRCCERETEASYGPKPESSFDTA